MDRLRAFFNTTEHGDQEYEPLQAGTDDSENENEVVEDELDSIPFSPLEYSLFLLLGVAMLWAWNMFLAATPYFQMRFSSNDWIAAHFQSAILSVSTTTNLVSMIILTKLQTKASYPKRIIAALLINIAVFILLTVSTVTFQNASATSYLVFVLCMVLLTSVATGLMQNGIFAFASSFARPEYIQGVMAGQGIAGVLPCIAQILSVLSVPEPDHWAGGGGDFDDGAETAGLSIAAFIFFSTACIISSAALISFFPLIRRHHRMLEGKMMESIASIDGVRTSVGILSLYRKLSWLAASIFLCFAISMFFPVMTSQVLSVRPADDAPRLFQPESFIPLAFLFWNIGDLAGRVCTLHPFFVTENPRVLLVFSIARTLFLPLYQLCNIRGEGAVISSDIFYLIIVQIGFGMSNGWLGSSCMMGSGKWVDEGEREAAGGFMGLNLVAGLTAGSLLSFVAGR